MKSFLPVSMLHIFYHYDIFGKYFLECFCYFLIKSVKKVAGKESIIAGKRYQNAIISFKTWELPVNIKAKKILLTLRLKVSFKAEELPIKLESFI